jgi:hypothetical protein
MIATVMTMVLLLDTVLTRKLLLLQQTMRCSDYDFISSIRASASGPIRGNGAVQRDGLFYDRRVGLHHVGGRS